MPTGYMLQSARQQVGNFIGMFLEYDKKNNVGVGSRYMRIKVRIDVRKPLKRGKVIKKSGSEGKLEKLKYERLGVFCYICGITGHAEQSCESLINMTEDTG